MQIDSSWFPQLKRHGIEERHLCDPCVSLQVGAWILAQNLRRLRDPWLAVRAYNSPPPAHARAYALKVYRNLPPAPRRADSAGRHRPGRRGAGRLRRHEDPHNRGR